MSRYDTLRILLVAVVCIVGFTAMMGGALGLISPGYILAFCLGGPVVGFLLGMIAGCERPAETHEYCNRPTPPQYVGNRRRAYTRVGGSRKASAMADCPAGRWRA